MVSSERGPALRIARGDVVRVGLDPAEGSEQRGERPAVVLSPDLVNLHAPIIVVAPLTTRKTDNVYPFEALVEPPEGGLTARSKAMLLHIRGIDRGRVVGRLGSVTAETMARLGQALSVAAGLSDM